MEFPVYIQQNEIISDSGALIQPQNVELVGSYNWDKVQKCGILVPGSPPEFHETYSAGVQLFRDSGMQMVDENHYRQPKHATESLIRAVELCTPGLDFQKVDFATDRNNLRKLLRFINGTVTGDRDPSFTVFVDKVANLCVLTRVEESDQEPTQGFGHSFEDKFTKSLCVPGFHPSSYRRIIKYDLGDLKLVVRTETDAVKITLGGSVSDIAGGKSAMSITRSARNEWNHFEGSDLAYVETENGILKRNMGVVYELKTKNSRYKHEFNWADLYYQMLLGDVNRAFVGWLNRGRVESTSDFSLADVSKKLTPMARRDVQNALQKLVKLFKKIKSIASSASRGECGAYLTIKYDPLHEGKKLVITERRANDAKLPQSVYRRIMEA